MAIKAISPKEATKTVPDEVLESFNEIIAENISYGVAQFYQSKVVDRIISKGLVKPRDNKERQKIFDKNWLDVKEIYEKIGWDVSYSQSSFVDFGTNIFTFKTRPTG